MHVLSFIIIIIDFLKKNLTLISFLSILFGWLWYYTHFLLDFQRQFLAQIAEGQNAANFLAADQTATILDQQKVIKDLTLSILEKSTDLNALSYYAVGVTVLFVGLALFSYFNGGNPNTGGSSSTVIYGKDEFSATLGTINDQISEIKSSSKEGIAEVNDTYRETLAGVVGEISSAVGEVTASSLNDFKRQMANELTTFTTEIVAVTSEIVKTTQAVALHTEELLPKCESTNSRIKDLERTFLSMSDENLIAIRLQLRAELSSEIELKVMNLRSGIQQIQQNPNSAVENSRSLLEICTEITNFLN